MASNPQSTSGQVSARLDRLMALFIRAYFTKTNFLFHVVAYPALMSLEGGDFHLFLDGISIEAAFVGLMVGISTKTLMDHNHHLKALLHEALTHVGMRRYRDKPRSE